MKRDTYLLLAGFHREALLSVAVAVADLAVLYCCRIPASNFVYKPNRREERCGPSRQNRFWLVRSKSQSKSEMRQQRETKDQSAKKRQLQSSAPERDTYSVSALPVKNTTVATPPRQIRDTQQQRWQWTGEMVQRRQSSRTTRFSER